MIVGLGLHAEEIDVNAGSGGGQRQNRQENCERLAHQCFSRDQMSSPSRQTSRVAAGVLRFDAQTEVRVVLHARHFPQFIDSLDDVPFHARTSGQGDVLARLDRVIEMDFVRRYAQREQGVELGNGGDLETDALIEHDPEDIGMRVRFDGVMQRHARHCSAETAHLAAYELRIEQ